MVAGRPPKDDDAKRNRSPLTHQWVDVPEVAFEGPTLESLHPGKHWHEATLAWWDVVRTMPHCSLWWPADWMYAARTAFLWNDVHSDDGPAASMIGQISRREDRLGMTDASRRQMRIRYVPVPAAAVKSRPKSDRRAHLRALSETA